jgi:hypothetical protein
MAHANLTAERLREVLNYDPETGIFTWKIKHLSNKQAGTVHEHGYRRIRVDSVLYLAHRLAWMYSFGSFPANEIDHVDGDKLNNRIDNLRDVPRSINAENLRAAKRHSISGVLGVIKLGSRYKARIAVSGKTICLGRYDTEEEAYQAYLKAKREKHVGCTI